MIINRLDWYGILAFYKQGEAKSALLKTRPLVIEIAGVQYDALHELYIGDCSPIASSDKYAVGVKFGYLDLELDHPLFRSKLMKQSSNLEFRVKNGLSFELVWSWSVKAGSEPNVNGHIMHSMVLKSSDLDWALCVPLDMFENDLWCDSLDSDVKILK